MLLSTPVIPLFGVGTESDAVPLKSWFCSLWGDRLNEAVGLDFDTHGPEPERFISVAASI